MLDSFIRQVRRSAQARPWIQRIEHQKIGKVARLRLYLGEDRFVAVYYNARTKSTSYAYVEGDQRLFGANNMRIGWHVHPYGQETKHVKCQPITIEEFLQLLEKELREQDRLI